MKVAILLILMLVFCYSDDYYYSNGKKTYLKEMNIGKHKRDHDVSGSHEKIVYYTTASGAVVGVGRDIIVKCKKNTNCKTKLLKYDIEHIEEIAKNYYLLHLRDSKFVFSLSRDIYNESYIELSHPDFHMSYTPY